METGNIHAGLFCLKIGILVPSKQIAVLNTFPNCWENPKHEFCIRFFLLGQQYQKWWYQQILELKHFT